jgi:CIC family chloride channel protein
VPIANPETVATLLEIATAIARDRHYEIECLQIMLVSRHSSPSETPVRTARSRRLLRQAEVLAKKWHIPLHTEIRVAHDAAQAILETINERHIDLILMGWKGNTSTPGRIFGNVVDTIIRQAACDVVLVKLGHSQESIVNGQLSKVIPTQHSKLSTQNSALSNATCFNSAEPPNAVAPQHSALSTQHSALSTQHSALSTPSTVG